MTHKDTDLRIRRTHKLLQDALIELIAEKGFDAITVGEIAERAMVNRATFYRHYQDKYDLAARIFEDIAKQLYDEQPRFRSPKEMVAYARSVDPADPPDEVIRLFEHVAEHAWLYRALLLQQGGAWFAARMRDYIVKTRREQGRRLLKDHPTLKEKIRQSGIPQELPVVMGAQVLIGTIVWWLESEETTSPRQMAEWFSRFLKGAISEYIPVWGLLPPGESSQQAKDQGEPGTT